MDTDSVGKSKVTRASEPSRKQRDGTKFIGGYGKKTGNSDLLFIEGQLPEYGGKIASDESPDHQLEICLQNLESELNYHGVQPEDILQLTLYLTEMELYDEVNNTYEEYFEDTYPARTTVGVSKLLGDAAVTIDAVIALE